MGKGTLLVSIPKGWAKKNKLTKAATVVVEELSERRLIVRPLEEKALQEEIVVDYPREDLTYVINDVTGAYLLGYDIIRIQAKSVVTREDRERLKSTIGRLIGLEIMDEDSKKFTLQFMLESTALNPERIAKRMVGIIEGMLKDTREGVAAGDPGILSLVEARDDEVDRLYFLLVRTVRRATIDPQVAERYKLLPVEILDYRVLASFLESVGDTVAELSKRLEEALPRDREANDFVECLKKLEAMQDLAIQSFLTRKASRSRGVYLQIRSLEKEVSELSTKIVRHGDRATHNLVELVGLLERASKIFADIADLSTPTYPTS